MNRGLRRGVGLDSFWPHNNSSTAAANGTVPQLDTATEGNIGWGTTGYVLPAAVTVNNPTLTASGITTNVFLGSINAEQGPIGLDFVGTENNGVASCLDTRSIGGATLAAHVATASGANIGGWHIGGDNGAGTLVDCAQIFNTATQTFSSTQWGNQWNFYTTQNGTTTKSIAFTIDQDGTVDAGVTGMTNTATRVEFQIGGSITQTFATSAGLSHSLMAWAGTNTANWAVNPSAFGMMTAINIAGTVKNDPGTTLTWAPGVMFAANPTVKVDTQTGADVKSWIGYSASTTFNVANSGTYTAGTITGFKSAPSVNGTGCTATSVTHFTAADTGGTNATLTNQFGLDIPALAKAATSNIGIRTVPPIVYTPTVCTCTANAATVPVNIAHAKVTNSSAATCTITLSTSGALDGQELRVRFLDASAVSQTVTFTNSETGKAGAPPVSLGSTTIPTTYRFIYNSGTSKWTYCSE